MRLVTKTPLFSLGCAFVAASTVQCSRPSDIVLECSAPNIRHVLRIDVNQGAADDLSAEPVKRGEAAVSDRDYLLRFYERRDRYELMFRIDRSTGRGTRELFDDEQQPIRGHGGYDEIVCAPVVEELARVEQSPAVAVPR